MTAPLLVEHPSLEPLIPHLKTYAVKGMNELLIGSEVITATAIEIYASQVMERVGELDNTIVALRLAMEYIIDLASEPDINAAAYRYHYENFLLRAVGAIDRSHKLVGASFLLEAAKYEAVGGNAYVKKCVSTGDPRVHTALVAIEQVVKSHKKLRNAVVHSTAFSSRELGLFFAIETIKPDFPPNIDPKKLMREHFSVSGVEIAKVIANLIRSFHTLLDSLAATYVAASEARV